MFPITSRVTRVPTTTGACRLYYQSRRVGEAVTVDNDALYVSHLFTESRAASSGGPWRALRPDSERAGLRPDADHGPACKRRRPGNKGTSSLAAGEFSAGAA